MLGKPRYGGVFSFPPIRREDGRRADLREQTRNAYFWAVERHLRPRYATRRRDAIMADDLAALVRELRAEGLSESSIVVVLGVAGRIFKFARRRLGYAGANPAAELLRAERPKSTSALQRRVWTPEEIEQTVAAAPEPWRTLFTIAALTGARLSEVCGLAWADVNLDDIDDATIGFRWQVDRHGRRVVTRPTARRGSCRSRANWR